MSQNMGSHPLVVQRRTLARGDAGVFGQEALDRIAAQMSAVQAWEQGLVGFTTALAEPDTQHRRRLHGERRDALFPTLAVAAHVRTGVEAHVSNATGVVTAQSAHANGTTVRIDYAVALTTDGRHLMLPRHTQPNREHELLLRQLQLKLPKQPPPKLLT